jgi:hypothetical protein
MAEATTTLSIYWFPGISFYLTNGWGLLTCRGTFTVSFTIYTVFIGIISVFVLETVTICGTGINFSTTCSTTFSTSTIFGTVLYTLNTSYTSTISIIYCLIIPITPSSIYGWTPVFSLIFYISSSKALIRTLK